MKNETIEDELKLLKKDIMTIKKYVHDELTDVFEKIEDISNVREKEIRRLQGRIESMGMEAARELCDHDQDITEIKEYINHMYGALEIKMPKKRDCLKCEVRNAIYPDIVCKYCNNKGFRLI